MATAASITTDWTTCPICLDVFDNPKSLPCIHGFCLKCLERYFKDNCPGDEVPCPLCRKEFKIPEDGLVDLQHHFFIQHLVDARNVSSQSTKEVPCETCLEENEEDESKIPAATEYCVDCNEKLCEKCARYHRRPKMKGGPHQVRPLGAKLEQELIQLRESSCDEHQDKQVELYCHECNENICLMCSAVKHRNHESAEIPDVADTFRPRMDDDTNQLSASINAARQHSEMMKQAVVAFQKRLADLEKKVIETGEAVKRNVDEQVNECLEELHSIRADSAEQSQIAQEQMQLALVALESFHKYSRELLDKGRPSDITRAASELHKKATELLANDVTSVEYWPPNVTFSPAVVTHVKLVGQINTSKSEDKTVNRVLHALPEGEPVFGVTFLNSLVYVLRLKSREEIEVYDTDCYSLQQCVSVPRLRRMSDMIACAHNRCLYVSGGSDKCVHRVGLLPDAGTTQWPVDDDASGLSLTDMHSVLVTCNEAHKIKEFSTQGNLLCEIQLLQDIVSPLHAIRLSIGQFIVSHGYSTAPAHRVCLVGSDGHVVKSHGGAPGSGSQRMNFPFHLAVDRNGFAFVGDVNNCRVLLLSPSLTYVREVVSRDQLKWRPLRMCLDVDRRSLYIADCKLNAEDDGYTTGRVIVVNV